MDIFCLRSTDGGRNFSEPVYLARGDDRHPTVNNPVMMQDKSGRIHLLYCENYCVDGRALHRFSDDDGITWSEPEDITYATRPEYRNVFAFGPGHGICAEDGKLLIPVWMVPKEYNSHPRAHSPSVISVLYSMDNGDSWQMGDILGTTPFTICPNETSIAELPGGGFYLNIRFGASTNYRGHAYSDNGYSDWRDYEPDMSLIDPCCFGSTAVYHGENGRDILLFVNCENREKRTNVTVKGSFDNGRTWPVRRVIDAERGGYADIACDERRGNIYVFYEDLFGATDTLATFNYEWLICH